MNSCVAGRVVGFVWLLYSAALTHVVWTDLIKDTDSMEADV